MSGVNPVRTSRRLVERQAQEEEKKEKEKKGEKKGEKKSKSRQKGKTGPEKRKESDQPSTSKRIKTEDNAAAETDNNNSNKKRGGRKPGRKPSKAKAKESDSEEGEYEIENIEQKVATLPDPKPYRPDENEDYEEHESLIWNPGDEFWEGIDEGRMNMYLEDAAAHNIFIDRALYILTQNQFDFEKATRACETRQIKGERYDPRDEELFMKSFAIYGKQFSRFRTKLPHRSVNSLVNYYYSEKHLHKFKVNAPKLREEECDAMDIKRNPTVTYRYGVCQNCEADKKIVQCEDRMLCIPCSMFHKSIVPNPLRNMLIQGPLIYEPEEKVYKYPKNMDIITDDFMEMRHVVNDEEWIKYKEMIEKKNPPKIEEDSDDDIMVIHETDPRPPPVVVEIRPYKAELCGMELHAMMNQKRDDSLQNSAEMTKKFEARKKALQKLQQKTQEVAKAWKKHEKEKVRVTSNWTDEEKEQCLYVLTRYEGDVKIAATLIKTKSVEMIKEFYNIVKKQIDPVIAENKKKKELIKKDIQESFGKLKI